MTQEAVLKTLAGASAAAGVGSGTFGAVMNYFDEHAGGMGVLCSLISILLFIIFKLWEISKTKKKDKTDSEFDKIENTLDQIKKEIKSISENNQHNATSEL